MVQRIVVGSDGSSRAEQAVQEAVALARGVGAALTIVRAYEDREPRDSASAYEPTLGDTSGLPEDVPRAVGPRAEAFAGLERDVAAAKQAGVAEVESVARAGDAADVLISVAEETGADVIVVGNRGMTGASRFLLGSVPNKITHHAPCSVLVARTS